VGLFTWCKRTASHSGVSASLETWTRPRYQRYSPSCTSFASISCVVGLFIPKNFPIKSSAFVIFFLPSRSLSFFLILFRSRLVFAPKPIGAPFFKVVGFGGTAKPSLCPADGDRGSERLYTTLSVKTGTTCLYPASGIWFLLQKRLLTFARDVRNDPSRGNLCPCAVPSQVWILGFVWVNCWCQDILIASRIFLHGFRIVSGPHKMRGRRCRSKLKSHSMFLSMTF